MELPFNQEWSLFPRSLESRGGREQTSQWISRRKHRVESIRDGGGPKKQALLPGVKPSAAPHPHLRRLQISFLIPCQGGSQVLQNLGPLAFSTPPLICPGSSRPCPAFPLPPHLHAFAQAFPSTQKAIPACAQSLVEFQGCGANVPGLNSQFCLYWLCHLGENNFSEPQLRWR